MSRRLKLTQEPLFLGIECGGTRTVAVLTDERDARRLESGPANLRLLSDAQLARHFRSLAGNLPRPAAVAIGMAGMRTASDRHRVLNAAAKAWPRVPCYATNDLETALEAAESITPARKRPIIDPSSGTPRSALPRVLVLSGTGSCCYGRAVDGQTAKVGGWGHVLGDKGSGYEIGLRALKAVVYYYDRDGKWSPLGRRLLRALQLNEPNDLVGWVQTASKPDVAALAVQVFEAWTGRDTIAADILEGAAHSLAEDAAACARRLARPGTPVQFIFAGSVLLKQPRFAKETGRLLRKLWPEATVMLLKRESVWGAVELAKQKFKIQNSKFKIQDSALESTPTVEQREIVSLEALTKSPTEQRNPLSLELDSLPLSEAIALMLREDTKIPAAILKESANIERAVDCIVRGFRRGGRLFYLGAGTSGRLGILDASECPPTFRTLPDQVQGIIAGGQRAIWEAVEGAEDDPEAGARALEFRGVDRRDVVVGITASGRTPFVWGALQEARRRGAATILLCFNPALRIPRAQRPTLVIAPDVGPEILTGSTRLKAGTATKLILNIFTTLSFARTGKVISNLMVDLNPSNRKLRDRAVRIVRQLTGEDYAAAQRALEKSGWLVKAAWKRLQGR
jgi:N-acetylmuramic acid 6-phosphate etherase